MARVVLRTPTLDDQDEFIACMRASRSVHRPWLYMPETPDAYKTYIARVDDPRAAPFLACRNEDGAIVGFLNISEIVRGNYRGAFLGYGGVARLRRPGLHDRGDAARAARSVHAPAICTGWRRTSSPATRASIALAKRCGFELEGFSPRYLKIGGRWRDHERWAIRKESWRTT